MRSLAPGATSCLVVWGATALLWPSADIHSSTNTCTRNICHWPAQWRQSSSWATNMEFEAESHAGGKPYAQVASWFSLNSRTNSRRILGR